MLGSNPYRNTGYPGGVLLVSTGPPSKSVYNENSKPTFVIIFLLMMVVVVVVEVGVVVLVVLVLVAVAVPFMTNKTLFHQHLLAQVQKIPELNP
jgi:Flp pilus assembly protein TadB